MTIRHVVLLFALCVITQTWARTGNTVTLPLAEFASTAGDNPAITVYQGDIVIFDNNDTKERWPASNIHPTHAIYSDFDPKKPIATGERWAFKFDKAGVWRWHDHLNPTISSQIFVKKVEGYQANSEGGSGENPAAFFSRSFRALKLWFIRTYYEINPGALEAKLQAVNMLRVTSNETELEHWITLAGVKTIMRKILVESGNGSKVDCHQEAHRVGRVAYKIYNADVFQESDTTCNSGFYHGAMEAFFTARGTENLAENIDKLCNTMPTNFSTFSCLHGVGHGLLAYLDYAVPQGLELCKQLESDFAKQSCYGGIFMENIVVGQGLGVRGGHTTRWLNQDPHFPCTAVDQASEIQYECYQMQTSRMLLLNGWNYDSTIKECTKAREDMIPVCFKSMGRDLAGQVLKDPERIKQVCSTVTERYQSNCIEGAVNVVIDFWADRLNNQASQLCDLLSLSGKQNCYQVVAKRLPELFKDENGIRGVCATFAKDFQHICPV